MTVNVSAAVSSERFAGVRPKLSRSSWQVQHLRTAYRVWYWAVSWLWFSLNMDNDRG